MEVRTAYIRLPLPPPSSPTQCAFADGDVPSRRSPLPSKSQKKIQQRASDMPDVSSPASSAKALARHHPVERLHFNAAPLETRYEIGDELGSGQFATVKRVIERATGQKYAAKFVRKRRYATSRRGVPRENIEREVEVLKAVRGHENVVELHEVYETPTDVILILELVSGGELFDHVCGKECLDEAEAAAFIKQILLAVRHLHSHFVVHLDIKPENVMLKTRGETQIKLIDFGLSRQIYPGVPVKDIVGTPEFIAPEIVNYEPLSTATDMWAIGVVTYILLSGGSPFLGETRNETFANITAVNYHFSDRFFGNTSQQAKDFISRLFVRDQRHRATVEQCLNHSWIRGCSPDVEDVRRLSTVSVAQLQGYRIRSKWRRAIEIIILCNKMTKRARITLARAEAKRSESSPASERVPDTRYNEDELITSAVLIACEEGNLAALKELATVHRMNLDVVNRLGETAVHVSAGAGHPQIVMFLHSRGCPISTADSRGDTPLFWAARNGHGHVIRYLCQDPDQVSINGINKSEETALHVATRYSQTDAALALLEAGANIDLQDEHGETAMHIASWHGYASLLHVLCKFEPNMTLRNQDDETALHCAAARGHMECVQSLLEGGAPVDALDQAGQTALHMALRRGHLDIALLLITRGCGFNIQDEHGDTPIHIAARFGLLTAVQTLCHLGAAVDLTNADQQTPLHIAAAEGHIEIVRVLCLAGATVAKKNKDGLTAELVALGKEHVHVAALLAKMKSEAVRDAFMDQLIVLDVPLRRIKLKFFSHCGNGKSRLVQGLQAGDRSSMIGSFIGAVSRRFSDNPHSPSSSSVASSKSKDEGIYGSQSSTNSAESNNNKDQWSHYFYQTPHSNYTRGIDVQNVNLPGCGEFSVWEFGGYEPYHVAYDHFVGNTDCIHVVLFNATDATEDQYKQVLYWMNFLKGRVSPSEPIGHCGVNSRRSRVVIVGTHATPEMFERNQEGDYVSSDCDAMLKTIRLRFQTHFDIHDKLILLDSTSAACPGMKGLRSYLQKTRECILNRLVKPLSLLESCSTYLTALRKQHADFPVVTWPEFIDFVREEINPLASDSHTRQLIHQLQLIGEVVYLRDESTDQDFVVLVPEWLGTHIIGQLLSAEFMSHGRSSGCYSVDDFAQLFPEIQDPTDLLHILDTLQLCAPTDANGDSEYEFPALNLMHPPKDVWQKDRPSYVYGGVRVLPARGMERSLQSTFPRIQVALRRSMHDFQDPMDADLVQWYGCSKMSSGQMESLIRLRGDAVEIQVRGPIELSTSCFYFLEDVANLVEQTASEVAPVISLERHFLSPKHLKEHNTNAATFLPESIMAMQQQESLTIKNTRDETDELFTDVVCFGSREVAGLLTLGIDVCVSQLQMTTRCELAALLDPPDTMGRDWSILACKLNLTDQLPEVDSSGQSLSRTDQLLAEWSLHSPESATVGRLCAILEELGRPDARDAIYRTVPLYLFEPLDDQGHHLTANVADDCGDSGVVSSSHSTNEAACGTR